MKTLYPIIMILFIIALFVNKRYKTEIDKIPFMKPIAIIIITLTSIIFFTTIFIRSDSNDNKYGWSVDYMSYKKLHKYSTGKTQKIALIDTGISEFQLEKNKSITLTGNDYDNNGHGTMMYSIIKGYEDEIYGIAPDADIISIKILESDEKLKVDIIIKAIEVAIEKECTIINFSIGSYKYNEDIAKCIDLAINKGITFVASSGEYSNKDMMFPANKDGVISVGSISANGIVSDFTNASEQCIINSPGDEIKTVNNKKFIEKTSGTSQATAIFSGYISLLKDYANQKGTSISNEKIISLLKDINNKKYSYVSALKRIE